MVPSAEASDVQRQAQGPAAGKATNEQHSRAVELSAHEAADAARTAAERHDGTAA